MMTRMLATLTVLVGLGMAALSVAADLKPIHTQKTKDVVVTVESESGQWKPGKNEFVLTFTSPKDQQSVDAGKVALWTKADSVTHFDKIAIATLQ